MKTKLKQKIAALADRAEAIVKSAAPEGLTDEQRKQLDTIKADIDVAKADLERISIVDTKPVITAVPAVAKDPMFGFKSLGEMAQSVQQNVEFGVQDERLGAIKAAATSPASTKTTEGYLVPAPMAKAVWDLVPSYDGLYNRLTVENTNSNHVEIIKDETTPWGATGIKAYWRSESGAMTQTKQTLTPMDVKLHELYVLCSATGEILQDAPLLTSRLMNGASRAMAYKMDEAIMEGDGVGKPLGIKNAACLVSQAKKLNQTADTIVAENVVNMYARMLNFGGPAVWLVNPDAWNQLPLMTIGDQPIWTAPSEGLKSAPGGTLLGRPVIMSELCETLGDKYDIMLVSLDGYYAAKRGEAQYDESIHLWFDTNEKAFRWIFRFGGQPILSAAVTPPNSAVTRSHFVTLDARA